MRKIYTLIVLLFISISLLAQSPELISYQAVIRDSDNNLVTNTSVGMQISILQGSATAEAVYIERQFPTTNSNGLVSIEIGGDNATVVSGDFSTIDWSSGIYFIKTETDLNGGSSYTITGTSQILSVPYALYAKTAENITGSFTETDPEYNAWNKSYNDLTSKPNIIDSINTVLDTTTKFLRTEVDGSVTNELQTLSLINNELSISGGNSIMLNTGSTQSNVLLRDFPDGFENVEIISQYFDSLDTYTVPEGKNLYLTKTTGTIILNIASDSIPYRVNGIPQSGVYTILKNNCWINGVLVDAKVEPVNKDITNSLSYTVPECKTFVLKRILFIANDPGNWYLNGNRIASNFWSTDDYYYLNTDDIITIQDNEPTQKAIIFGYLIP